MGFLKKLTRLFTVSAPIEDRALFIYVQCNRCNEKIRARVDLLNDLSPIYNESGVTYFSRKVIMGEQRCFQKIEVEMNFDERRRITDRKISGGRFIAKEDLEPQAQ